MDISKLIINTLQEKGEVRSSDIIKTTGFSRAYINRFLQQLREEGRIILVGKANNARYIPATKRAAGLAMRRLWQANRILQNKGLDEDTVLADIKSSTGIFIGMPKNITDIFSYALLEMLNNAIEHSMSKDIKVIVKRKHECMRFDVIDKGVGIFNNIMQKKNLPNEMSAIQDLLKGKQTTAPKNHSGEGIFFTSKLADVLTIKSSYKQLIFNNLLEDVFIRDINSTSGTKVAFTINTHSKRLIEDVFRKYTDDSFEFSKTKVIIRLYKMDKEYISRSQARRVLSGLDKFKTITMDFKGVNTIGQGFADEVFRVWKLRYPDMKIIPVNMNENIEFMVKRALS
jgi:anti-sigma regulatory factor (Ser/Thr protein kinase)